MIENATNLTNITSCVGVLRGFWVFLSDYWQELSALAAIITIISVVIGLFFKRYLQKKQHEHEKEMEKLRQEYDEKVRQQPKLAAKNQIIRHLERFVYLENRKQGIDKSGENYRVEMAESGNKLKTVVRYIDENLMLFPWDILNKAYAIADEIINLSKGRGVVTVGSKDLFNLMNQQRKERDEEWDKLVEKARKLIEELQQEEGEDKK